MVLMPLMWLLCCIMGIQAVNGSSHPGWLLDEIEKPGKTISFGGNGSILRRSGPNF